MEPMPGVVEYLPAGQAEQADACAGAYHPKLQLLHEPEDTDAYDHWAHGEHTEEPASAWVPARHPTHADAVVTMVLGCAVPAWHCWHTRAPSELHVPVGHGAHENVL